MSTYLCIFRDFISDFDLMIEKKKEERQKQRRRRKDIDMINDNDDLIADMIGKMKVAAEVHRHICVSFCIDIQL